jgi:hypothetical protein
MPEMEGYEATGWIRKLEDGKTRVPVIAMTANAMVGDRDKCLQSGMDDYISKPVDASKFVQTLARWIPGESPYEETTDQGTQETSQNAPVNTSHLEMFTDGDKDVERELFGLFSEQALLALEQLEQTCGDGASQDWKSAAHKFKGAAANLGAERLSALCYEAESGFTEPYDKKLTLVSSIRAGYEEVQHFLEERTAA